MVPPTPVAPPFDPGTVWLDGAGPGDAGLLTPHAAGIPFRIVPGISPGIGDRRTGPEPVAAMMECGAPENRLRKPAATEMNRI